MKSIFPENVHVYYLNTRLTPINLIKSFLALKKLVKNSGISLIHAQYGTITAFMGLLVSFNRRLIITFRGSDINGSNDVSYFRRTFALLCSWIAMSFADKVIFVSQNLMNKSPKLFKDATIIKTGVDLQIFKPELMLSKKSLGLKDQTQYALFYSSYNSPNKRRDLAVSAIELLHKKGFKNIELLEIEGNIPASVMPQYINSSSVVLMLSNNEGSPTIVQEAMACGVPVVSVLVGDVEELLIHVPNSLIVERDPESISEGILKALKIGFLMPTPRILAKISLDDCVKKVAIIYREFETK
jgi:glycosyltransferase involved in cell wall biosynthesis